MSISILGHAVQRREDLALLTGEGRYVADLVGRDVLHAHFVRSTSAHAEIRAVRVADAQHAAGVVGVFVADDLALPPLGEFPPRPEGSRPALGRPCLARHRARFVGEAIAVVVAERRDAAVDAAELVEVDLDPLPAVVDPVAALDPDAPLLFPSHGSNVVIDFAPNDSDTDPLRDAEVVVKGRFYNQRVAPVPLEAQAVLAVPQPDGSLTIWASTQAPFAIQALVSAALGLPPESVRVVAPAVGGGFGAKGGVAPEHLVVAALALRLQRPVVWEEARSENLLAMSHGRGQVQEVELGARRDGTLVGMRARTITEVGAYAWRGGIATRTSRLMATGVYRIPRLALHSLGVVTNTTPVGPYRGAGRPEATAMLERAMDLLAAEIGVDPAELRRRNLLAPADFPYLAPSGASYDSGDYQGALDEVLRLADYDGLRAEQVARSGATTGNLVGVGISCFVEVSGSGSEYGAVRIEADGSVTVSSGSAPHGQGHETTLAQIAAHTLGAPIEAVRVVHSDTALVARGVGTFGSRSGQLAGSAVLAAGQEVVARARDLAAELFEAAAEDIVRNDDGGFYVLGVPSHQVSWADLAAAARRGSEDGNGDSPSVATTTVTIPGATIAGLPGLAAEADFAQPDSTYPFGAHLAVVDVDIETGRVDLRRMIAVDDCGTVVNPVIVAGQVHGGLAQGVAQALYEAVSYDGSGNPLTTNLADYLVPSAADLPSWELGATVTPSPRNPLGMKGIGESGAVGSSAAVQNAVLDALRPLGVRHLDMPLSPERVWRAIADASSPIVAT